MVYIKIKNSLMFPLKQHTFSCSLYVAFLESLSILLLNFLVKLWQIKWYSITWWRGMPLTFGADLLFNFIYFKIYILLLSNICCSLNVSLIPLDSPLSSHKQARPIFMIYPIIFSLPTDFKISLVFTNFIF